MINCTVYKPNKTHMLLCQVKDCVIKRTTFLVTVAILKTSTLKKITV